MPATLHGALRRYGFVAATALLVAAMAVAAATAVRDDSATFDEALYIAAGYSYLATGDYRMNAEHPPVAKLLAALPLVPFHPDAPTGHPSWRQGDLRPFATEFLYRNHVPADTILFAARSVNIVLAALLGLAIALWTRRHFGPPAALLALFLYATDPNFLAHGRYATNDLPVATFMFLAAIAWSRYLVRKRWIDLAMAGVAASLALLAKFSAVLLAPLFVALYLVRAWQEKDRPGPRLSVERFAGVGLAMAGIFVVLTGCAYRFRSRVCAADAGLVVPCTLAESVGGAPRSGHFLMQAARAFHLPDHPYLVGLFMQVAHQDSGHATYLLGQRSEESRWYYMPVAFAVKTPTAMVVLTVAAVLAGALWLFRGWRGLREVPFPWITVVMSATVLGLATMSSRVALGIRYLLPVYPFLFVLAGALVFRVLVRRAGRFSPWLLTAIVVVQMAESAAIYPGHLAFFNTISGGPRRGDRYLVDSNLDWGQDLIRLKQYMDKTGTRLVCLYYFGTAPAEYYGISSRYLPYTSEKEERAKVDCIAAISVTALHDVYLPRGNDFAWLRAQRPIATAGRSIRIYDLRRTQPVQ